MRVNNVDLEYFIDYINNRIHLLDSSNSSYSNLPNVIGPEFQKELIEQEHLLIDVMDFEWVLYCSSKLIMTYKNYGLQLMPKSETWLHGPFLSRIEGN